MTELNIKKEIGKRIFESRKAKGLTLKDLGELAGGLKQTRLTNWEQGTRTPGPEEIKWLAQALDVSPAYLMCLSDEKQFREAINLSQLIPLLDHKQACEHKLHLQEVGNSFDLPHVSVSSTLLPKLSSDAFAVSVLNDSMIPEFRLGDLLVIEPNLLPKPGDFVLVKIDNEVEAVICQYKKISYSSSDFELLTLNSNWPNLSVTDGQTTKIIGKVIQNLRSYN